jgi:hypothetical protein
VKVGTFVDSLQRASEFFAGRGEMYAALDKIERVLTEENIEFAVIGGMALNFHGYRHVTNDLDVLTTPEGLRAIHQRLVGDDYRTEGVRNLRDVQNDVVIDILVREGPIEWADFEGHRIIALTKLIELKLTAGLASRGRIKELADVQDLIKFAPLPRELGEQLDPSVRDEYYRIWDAAQNGWDPSAG